MVQNLFNAVKSRRSANRGGDYQYNYNYQPAPAAAAPRGSTRGGGGPDYSSPAWQASSTAGGAHGAPPAPPAKGRQERSEPHNPLAGGGSLLEDDEDDEDEQALAMPGTQQNGHAGNLV